MSDSKHRYALDLETETGLTITASVIPELVGEPSPDESHESTTDWWTAQPRTICLLTENASGESAVTLTFVVESNLLVVTQPDKRIPVELKPGQVRIRLKSQEWALDGAIRDAILTTIDRNIGAPDIDRPKMENSPYVTWYPNPKGEDPS
jgi:hypothetical protein